MRRGRMIGAACLLAVFASALVVSLGYSLTDALGPGPGFFPFWLSLVGTILTLGMLVQTARSTEPDDAAPVPAEPHAFRQGLVVLLALAAATALLEPLGYRLTMLAFIAGLLTVLGARSLPGIALTALAGSFGVFHVFYHWLKVPLPIGALGL